MGDFNFTVDIDVSTKNSYTTLEQLGLDIEKAKVASEQLKKIIEETKNSEDELTRAQHARAVQVKQTVDDSIDAANKIRNSNYYQGKEISEQSPVTSDSIWGRAVHSAKVFNDSDYGLDAFKKAISSLPQEIQASFSKIETAVIPSLLKAYKDNVINYDNQQKPEIRQNTDSIIKHIMGDRNFKQAVYNSGSGFINSDAVLENITRAIVAKHVPYVNTNTYLTNRGILPTTKNAQHRVEDAFESQYIQAAIRNLGEVKTHDASLKWNRTMSGLDSKMAGEKIDDKTFTWLASLLKNNANAMRVAENFKIGKDKEGNDTYLVSRKNGTATLNRDVTYDQILNKFQGALYTRVMKEAGGLYTDFHNGQKRNVLMNNNAANREAGFTNVANAGTIQALNHMATKVAEINQMIPGSGVSKRNNNWVFDASDVAHTEDRRTREQYVVLKANPFAGKQLSEAQLIANDFYDPFDEEKALPRSIRLENALFRKAKYKDSGIAVQPVALNANEWTRYANEKHIATFADREQTDAFKLIGLKGYDSSNKEHKQTLEDIFKQYTDPNNSSGYIFGGIHGLGDSAEIRLIKKEYADAVNKKSTDEAVRMYKAMGVDMTRKELDDAGMLTAFKHAATGGFDYASMWKNVEKMAPGKERDDAFKAFNKAIDAGNKIFTESDLYSGGFKASNIPDYLKNGTIIVTDSEVKGEREVDYTRGKLHGNKVKDITSADGYGWVSEQLGNVGDVIQARIGTSGKGVFSVVKDVLGGYKAAGIDTIKVLGNDAFNTSENVLANFDISMLKDASTIRKIADEKGTKGVSDYLKAQIAMYGINSVNNATDDKDAEIIGAQANRQTLPNLNKAVEQATIRSNLLRKMRNGDADTIYSVLYNNGNSNRFNQIKWDRNAPLNNQVIEDIDNWAASTMASMISNEGKLFDTDKRGGYGYRKLATNNIFSEYTRNNYGSQEMLDKLAAARAGGEADTATTNFMKWQDAMFAQLEKQFDEKQLEEIGLGKSSANRDMILAKMLSLEGLYGADGKKLANVFFDNQAGISGTLYRNPGQFGETFTAVNLYSLLGKAMNNMGENTNGTMLGLNGLLQLAGADFDGDNVKNFGIRGLDTNRLLLDLGLDNNIANNLKVGTLLSSLNSDSSDLEINEKYGEQIKKAIETRTAELDNIDKTSKTYTDEYRHIEALKEISNKSTDTYSMLHQNEIANKILEEAANDPAYQHRLNLDEGKVDSSFSTNLISALVGYTERSIDSAAKMGGASNIAANISGAFVNTMLNGKTQDISTPRLKALGLESVIGNDLYDLYSTLAKKPVSPEDGYLQGVYDYSKTGTPISRLAALWSGAKVKRLSDGMYGKGDDESFEPYNVPGYIEDKNGKYKHNPNLILLDNLGTKAIDLTLLRSRNSEINKNAFGMDASALALNTLGFTSSDFAARTQLLLNAKINPDEAEQNYGDMKNAFEKIVTDNIYHSKIFRDKADRYYDEDKKEWITRTDEKGNKVYLEDSGDISKHGATARLMYANADFLAGELSGKRTGLKQQELSSLAYLLAASGDEITAAAQNYSKYKRTIYDKQTGELITQKEKDALVAAGAEDSDTRFRDWSQTTIEDALKKSTGWNVWAARLGSLQDSYGNIGGFGSTNAELQLWLEMQKKNGMNDNTYKILSAQLQAQEEQNLLNLNTDGIELSTKGIKAFETYKENLDNMADIDWTYLAKIPENANNLREVYKSLGAVFDEFQKEGNTKTLTEIASKHGLKKFSGALEGVSSLEEFLSEGKLDDFKKLSKQAMLSRHISSDVEGDSYALINKYAEGEMTYETSAKKVERLTNKIEENNAALKTQEDELTAVNAQLEATPNDDKLVEKKKTIEETTKALKAENNEAQKELDIAKQDNETNATRRVTANNIVDSIGYAEKLKAAQNQLFGLNSKYDSVMSPYAGMKIGSFEISYDEQKDFFIKAQQSAGYKYKDIQNVIDNPLTDDYTRKYMTKQLNEAKEKEAAVNMLQYRARVGQLTGENLGPTYAQQWNSGYTNRLNELNSLYSSPDNYIASQIVEFVNNNKKMGAGMEFDTITAPALISGILDKDAVNRIYKDVKANYDNLTDEKKEKIVGFDAFNNAYKNAEYARSAFQGKSAEEVLADFNKQETGKLTTDLTGLVSNIKELRTAAATGNPAAITQFTQALKEMMDVINSLGTNDVFNKLRAGNRELNDAFLNAQEQPNTINQFYRDLAKDAQINNINSLMELRGSDRRLVNFDKLGRDYVAQKQQEREDAYFSRKQQIESKSYYNQLLNEAAGFGLSDKAAKDSADKIKQSDLRDLDTSNERQKQEIKDFGSVKSFRDNIEQLFGITLSPIQNEQGRYRYKNSSESELLNFNYNQTKAYAEGKINSAVSKEEREEWEATLKDLETNKSWLEQAYKAKELSADSKLLSNAQRFLPDDISSQAVTQAYVETQIAQLRQAKQKLLDEIAKKKANGQDATLLENALAKLNSTSEQDYTTQLENNSDVLKNTKSQLTDAIYASKEWKSRTSGARAFNTMSMRFGKTTFQQQGQYLLDSLISSTDNEYQSNLKEKKDIEQQYGGQIKFDGSQDVSKLSPELQKVYNRWQQINSLIPQQANQLNTLKGVYSGFGATAVGALQKIGTYISRIATQYMRKMWTEAKKFVKEFETSMTTIQAITLKSDEQMESVRSSAISKAQELKTSVSSITKIQQELYRQGLSDNEVNNRTDIIAKYSAVTGQDISGSLKSLTVAVNSGLVDNLQEAADVLVALGDAAATTAAEIAKGLQKSAAAAANAGMTYEELTALLTVGTSKTQLGGSQIGRSVNSVLSRMRRVTNEGMSTSEDGTVSINDVEQALSNVGVSLRDGADSFRSATDVLVDLAGVWEDLSDVQKANISYVIAGTTQGNTFQTLMAGLAEDDSFKEYLSTAEDSEGTLDSKYEIIKEGLNASLTALTTAFDSLVETLSPLISGFQLLVDGLTSVINFFGNNFFSAATLVVTAMYGLYKVTTIIPTLLSKALGINTTAFNANTAAVAANTAAQGGNTTGNIINGASGAAAGATGGIFSKLFSTAGTALKSVLPSIVKALPYAAIAAVAVAATAAAISYGSEANVAKRHNESVIKEAKTNSTAMTNSTDTIVNSIKEKIENNRINYSENATLKESVDSQTFSFISEWFGTLKNLIPGFDSSIDLATVSVEDFIEALNGATEASNEYARAQYAKTLTDEDKAIKVPVSALEELPSYSDIVEKYTGTETFEDMYNTVSGKLSRQETLTKEEQAWYDKVINAAKNSGYGNYVVDDFIEKMNQGYTLGWQNDSLIDNIQQQINDGDESLKAADLAYEEAVKKTQTKNVSTVIGYYHDTLTGMGFSEDDISAIETKIIADAGSGLMTKSRSEIIKLVQDALKEIGVNVENGISNEEILSEFSAHNYAVRGYNERFYTEEEATAFAKKNGLDNTSVYNYGTGKSIVSTAQDYLTNANGDFNFSEKKNKLDFAAYVGTFNSLEDFFVDINSSKENLDKYASYLSDENISKVIANIQAGTASFEDLQQAVLEYASGISESVLHSTEVLQNASSSVLDNALLQKAAAGTMTEAETNAYALKYGLLLGQDADYYANDANYRIKTNTQETQDAVAPVGQSFVNSIFYYLDSNGYLESLVGKEDATDTEKWNAFNTYFGGENLIETLDKLLKGAEESYGVDSTQYQYLANLKKQAEYKQTEGYTFGAITPVQNSRLHYNTDTDTYTYDGYGAVTVDAAGNIIAENPTTDTNGFYRFQNFSNSDAGVFSVTDYADNVVKEITNQAGEKIAVTLVTEGENAGKYIDEDGNVYGEINTPTILGNKYAGTYSIETGYESPFTYYDVWKQSYMGSSYYTENAQNVAVMDALKYLSQNGTGSWETYINDENMDETTRGYLMNSDVIQDVIAHPENLGTAITNLLSTILQSAAKQFSNSDVQSWYTATTDSGRWAATSNMISSGNSYAEAAAAQERIKNGTATSEDYTTVANYTGLTTSLVRSNSAAADSVLTAKKTDLDTQTTENAVANAKAIVTLGGEAAKAFEGVTIDTENFTTLDSTLRGIANGTIAATEDARKLAQQYVEAADAVEDTVTATEKLDEALQTAKDSMNTEAETNKMISALSSGTLEITNMSDKWKEILATNTEATKAIEQYNQGLITAEQLAIRLQEALTDIVPDRSETELDTYAERAFSNGNLWGNNWEAGQKAFNKYMLNLSTDDPTGYSQMIERYSYLDKMIKASNQQEWEAAKAGYQVQRWAYDNGVSDDFSGYSDYVYGYMNATSEKDKNNYLQQMATKKAEYEYYKGIIQDAKDGKTVDETTLKAAEDYFGGFAYNSDEAAAAIEELGTTISSFDELLKTILGDNYDSYDTAYQSNLDNYQNGTYNSRVNAAAVSADERKKIDDFYAWVIANPDKNLEDYEGYKDLINNTSIGETLASQTMTREEKISAIAPYTTSGQYRNPTAIGTEAEAQAVYDYISKGDYAGLETYYASHPGARAKAEEMYGSEFVALGDIDSTTGKSKAEILGTEQTAAITSEAGRNKELYYLNQQKAAGTISDELYSFAQGKINATANAEDEAAWWNNITSEWATTAQQNADTRARIDESKANLGKAKTTAEQVEVAKAYLGSEVDENWTDAQILNAYRAKIAEDEKTVKTSEEGMLSKWQYLTPEERAAHGLPVDSAAFEEKYGYNPDNYLTDWQAWSKSDTLYNDEAMGNNLYDAMSGASSKQDVIDYVEADASMQAWLKTNTEAGEIYRKLANDEITLAEAQRDLGKLYKKDARSVADYSKNMAKLRENIKNTKYYLDKDTYDKSDGSDDLKDLASITGLSEETLQGMTDGQIKDLVKKEYAALQEEYGEAIMEAWEDFDASEYVTGLDENGNQIVNIGGIELVANGEVKTLGIEQAIAMAKETGQDLLVSELESIAAEKGSVSLSVWTTTGADGKPIVHAAWDGVELSGVSGSRSSSSGGGGGGKSAAEKAMTAAERKISVNKHRVNMVQKEEEYYQNAGELTNYGTMLKAEQKEQKLLKTQYESAIGDLKTQLGKTTKYSDDWYELRDQMNKRLAIQ